MRDPRITTGHAHLMEVIIPADLIRAYEAADYWLEAPASRTVLKIGQPFSGFDGSPGHSRLAIVTANNPFSRTLGDAQNAARQAQLVDAVERAGLKWFRASGADPEGEWPPEPSLAILDATDPQLDCWMEVFGQNAVVVADYGGLATLRLHPRHITDRTGAGGEVAPTPTQQTAEPKIEQPNSCPAVARLEAALGCDVHVDLTLTRRNRAKVQTGKPFSVRGKGYFYEGDFFWDYWDFSGGSEGKLVVRSGSPRDGDYSAVGWDGAVGEALCDAAFPSTE